MTQKLNNSNSNTFKVFFCVKFHRETLQKKITLCWERSSINLISDTWRGLRAPKTFLKWWFCHWVVDGLKILLSQNWWKQKLRMSRGINCNLESIAATCFTDNVRRVKFWKEMRKPQKFFRVMTFYQTFPCRKTLKKPQRVLHFTSNCQGLVNTLFLISFLWWGTIVRISLLGSLWVFWGYVFRFCFRVSVLGHNKWDEAAPAQCLPLFRY